MSIKKVLDNLDFLPDNEEYAYLEKQTDEFVELLKKQLAKDRVFEEVFVGGSFAKGTLVKKPVYDIDIFVRFDWRVDDISPLLEKALKPLCKKAKLRLIKLHGSRDYFHVIRSKKLIFEVVPVTKIKQQKEAKNVTDLSYFHVNYIKKKIAKNKKLAKEIALAKTFCRAQNVYGAESYINGFSGYGLECLIVYYRSFEKMLKALAKTKAREQIIIDIEKKYKKSKDVFFELNESKLKSPIILIDPTWKERNALAALSNKAFEKFQDSARIFLKHPSKNFFEHKKPDINTLKEKAKKSKAEFMHIKLETDRQEGDIAGTKLKKFTNFLTLELEKYFNIINKEFEYDEKQGADVYLVLEGKKEIVRIGPPVKMLDYAAAFRKENKNVFEKGGLLHTKIKVNFSAKKFINNFAKKDKNKLKEMGITDLKVN